MTKKQITWCLVGIMFLAMFFRLWRINSAPPGLYPDEAINGMNAATALETGEYKVFYPDNFGREGLYINVIAFSFKIFGVNVWSLRMVSALFGILTVLGLYLLAKELFDEHIGLIASFLLAISFWHVNFSRIAFRGIMVPFCLVFGFYFLFRAFRRNYYLWDLIWSGIFFGLGFHTYIAFRIVPIFLVLVLGLHLVKKYKFKARLYSKERFNKFKNLWNNFYNKEGWWKFDIFILTIILVMLPLLIHFTKVPADFTGRTGEVSVFSAEEGFFLATAKSAVLSLGMFNFVGDGNWRHNYAYWPMLSIPIGILFLLGLFIVTKRYIIDNIKKRRLPDEKNTLLLSWFIFMLAPAIMSSEGLPHALRTIGVIPVVYIFAAIGFVWLIDKLRKLDLAVCFISSRRRLNCLEINTFITIFIMLLIPMQLYKYFYKWAPHPKTEEAFTTYLRNTGEYINNLATNALKLVVIKNPLPDQSIKLVTYNTENVKYFWNNEREQIDETIKNFAKDNKKRKSGLQRINIFTTEHHHQLFLDLLEKYPDGMIEKKEGFWTFRLYR